MSEGHSDPELPDEFAPLPLLPASFSACPLPSPTTGLQPACLSASTTTGLSPAKNSFRSPLRPGRARKPQEVARRASRLPEALSPDSSRRRRTQPASTAFPGPKPPPPESCKEQLGSRPKTLFFGGLAAGTGRRRACKEQL